MPRTTPRTHGGPRPGAGRKPLQADSPTVRLTITLPAHDAAVLRRLGGGNASAGARRAIALALRA